MNNLLVISSRLTARGIAAAVVVLWAMSGHAAGPGAQYYNEYLDKDLLYPDLPVVMWDETERASPQECNLACSDAGYAFAGKLPCLH